MLEAIDYSYSLLYNFPLSEYSTIYLLIPILIKLWDFSTFGLYKKKSDKPFCKKRKNKNSRIPQRNGDSRTKAGSRQDDTAVTCSSSKDLFKK